MKEKEEKLDKMKAKKVMGVITCMIMIATAFLMLWTENATSSYTVTIEDDPYPDVGDLAVFSSEISVDEPLFVGLASTIGIDVHNLGITQAVTWHDGDYAEYDFYQSSDQTLDIKIRIRSSGDPTDTNVKLDGALIASFVSRPEYDLVTIHDVPISVGDHTIRVTQVTDSPPNGDDLRIDWLEIGDNRIEAELYDRSDGTDPNPGMRGVDTINPSDITLKFFVDGILIAENDKIGSHSNPVPGGYPYPEAYFIPNNGSTHNSTSWVPSTPGYHTICIEVNKGKGSDSDLTNNIAFKTVYVGGLLPPIPYLNVSQDRKDVILYWDPPPILGIDHYLIYRSESQTSFDFNTVWVNTSMHKEPEESKPIPLRTVWNDTNAAFPGDTSGNYKQQYYYIIRAVDIRGEISRTSRTVGKWTKEFSKGISTFSLPLEPLKNMTTDCYLTDMNALYIKWMNPTKHIWMKHGDSRVNNTKMKVGEGFEVKFSGKTNYTFTGLPGAMVQYDDDNGFLGFDPDSNAKNLTVSVENNGDVNISWQETECMDIGDWYEVYNSSSRDGFFGAIDKDYFLVSRVYFGNNTASHVNAQANAPGVRLYYMVVPYNTSGVRGASTYSIGIWTEEYRAQYDTFGIPLRLSCYQTADWYCDNIPGTVGINYFIHGEQRWGWHSTRMPTRAYDPVLEMLEGYQISTSSATKLTFVGV